MPIEFDLSFTGPETAQFRPREQKQRVYSLGINPYSHSSEYRPVLCRLEMRGVNSEIAGEREENGKEKNLRLNMETEARLSYLLTNVAGSFAVALVRNET